MCANKNVDLSAAVVDYWQKLPYRTQPVRMAMLEQTRAAVRAGESPGRALLPFVLGDHAARIVAIALIDYLAINPSETRERDQRLDDTIDWIRRGLALNGAAVFSALLSLADDTVDDRLRTVRLIADLGAVEQVHCELAAERPGRADRFFEEWRDLLQLALQRKAA